MAGWSSNSRGPRSEGFPPKLRKKVFARDGHRCQIGDVGCTIDATEVDHITPVFEGGTDSIDNGQAVCSSCHRKKTEAEALRARAPFSRRRPPTPHPGVKNPFDPAHQQWRDRVQTLARAFE